MKLISGSRAAFWLLAACSAATPITITPPTGNKTDVAIPGNGTANQVQKPNESAVGSSKNSSANSSANSSTGSSGVSVTPVYNFVSAQAECSMCHASGSESDGVREVPLNNEQDWRNNKARIKSAVINGSMPEPAGLPEPKRSALIKYVESL